MGLEHWALALAASPWVFLVVFAFAAVDGVFPPIPSESLVIALAAVSASSGHPDLVPLLLAAAGGAFAGDQVAYLIGTKVDVRRLRVLRSDRAQSSLDRADRAMRRRGASLIIAARYVPVGRVAVNMTAGSLGFPRRRFVLFAGVAAAMWAAWSAAIGIGAGTLLRGHSLVAVALGVAGGIAIGLAVDRVLHRWQERHGEAAVTDPTAPPAAGAPLVTGGSRSTPTG